MVKNKFKLIYVEWCDAITMKDGWYNLDDVLNWGKSETWTIRQAGYLIKETKKYILLASKYNYQKSSEDMFSELTKIPRTWIIKKQIISF
jgi:hypothetical protein